MRKRKWQQYNKQFEKMGSLTSLIDQNIPLFNVIEPRDQLCGFIFRERYK
ncbi:MAG: hypothetical protein KR126chlam2_00645 [Chlamydiae bacterium]|nr:hypothetical protein [Chlamydiota bacterium]